MKFQSIQNQRLTFIHLFKHSISFCELSTNEVLDAALGVVGGTRTMDKVPKPGKGTWGSYEYPEDSKVGRQAKKGVGLGYRGRSL